MNTMGARFVESERGLLVDPGDLHAGHFLIGAQLCAGYYRRSLHEGL